MEHKKVTLPGFSIAGIEIRSSNANAMNDIPPFWQRFYGEGIQGKIQNKLDDDVIALYTNYEGDHTKPYTLVIGCRVSDAKNQPDGISSHSIPEATYAVFNPKGKLPGIVFSTWQHVWGSGLARTYSGDFEVYGKGCADPENAEMEIYIAIKE